MEITNQDQRPGESVSSIERIAQLLTDENESKTETEAGDSSSAQTEQFEQTDESNLESTDDQNIGEQEESSTQEDEQDVTWASALGVADEDLVLDEEGNFKGVKTKVNGKEAVVQLKDLIGGYQFNAANTQKAQILAEERRQFDQVRSTVAQEYTKKLDDVAKLTELLSNRFMSDYNNIDWVRLRTERPGEYAALQQDFNARRGELETIFSAINEDQSLHHQSITEEQQQQWNNHLAAQAQQVIDNNPEWRDVSKFKTAMTDFEQFVQEAYGFSPEEFHSVYDARLIELIKDAQKYRSGKQKIAQNKVEKVPTFQKKGLKTPAKTSTLDKLVKQAKSAKGYHKRTAETNAIAALLLGDKS